MHTASTHRLHSIWEQNVRRCASRPTIAVSEDILREQGVTAVMTWKVPSGVLGFAVCLLWLCIELASLGQSVDFGLSQGLCHP